MPKIRTEYSFIDEIREDYQLLIKDSKIQQKDRIPFICKEHGEYWQILNDHSKGSKCPKCSYKERSISKIKTDYPFIDEIHPDYQLLIKDKKIISHDKIPFICKKHGIYWQSLNGHSNGSRCPKCGHEYKRNKKGNI